MTIPVNKTLVIEPGVKVFSDRRLAGSRAKIKVEGQLIAEGHDSLPILFSSLQYRETPGSWGGIEVNRQNTLGKTQLKSCIIENASNGVTIISNGASIEDCLLRNNSQSGVFWNAFETSVSGLIKNSDILDNRNYGICIDALGAGDGSALATPQIIGNRIQRNFKGGIFIEARTQIPSSGTTRRNASVNSFITNNWIQENGGFGIESIAKGSWADGIPFDFFYRATVDLTIEGNLVTDNKGGYKSTTKPTGGGTWLSFSRAQIVNNTFAYNTNTALLLSGDSCRATVQNSIIVGSSNSVEKFVGADLTTTHSTIIPFVDGGSSMIDQMPLFSNISNGDYRLLAQAAQIDAGTNDVVQLTEDLVGTDRILDGDNNGEAIVDIGAFEYRLPEITAQPPATIEVCDGSELIISIQATGENLSYQWQLNGTNIIGAVDSSISFASVSINDIGVYTCLVTDELGGNILSNEINLSVEPQLNVSLLIQASALSICESDTVVFTATPVNEGANPNYQWLLNGQPTGNNSSTLSLNNLTNGDQVSCSLTSSATCAVNNPASSNSLEMSVFELPDVQFTRNDTVNIDQIPFQLTGGIPLGGKYTGPGISNNQFNPSLAGLGQHIITYTYTDPNGCTNSDTSLITVEMIVNTIIIANENSFKVFPNPTSGKVIVHPINMDGIWILSIYSPIGQEIDRKEINFQSNLYHEINLVPDAKGIYFITLQQDSQTFSKRIIVQ